MLSDILLYYLQSRNSEKIVGYIEILQFRTIYFKLNRTNYNLD